MVMYTIKLISSILDGSVNTVEVTKHAELSWTERIQRELKSTVFANPACNSWYKVESGWNSTVYSRSQTDFMLRCYFPKWSDWNIEYTAAGARNNALRKMLRYSAVLAVLLGTWWAKRKGTTLVNVVKGFIKDRANYVAQILTIVLMKLQERLQ